MKTFALLLIPTLLAGFAVFSSGSYGGSDILGAITYPTTLDTFTNPSATDRVNSPSHATQHANANDAIEALQAKVGADSSAVTTSHDYKLSGVTGSDLACSLTGTETLTNKTLTSPIMSDATSTDPKINQIYGTNGLLSVVFDVVSSAVNYFTLGQSATGNDVTLTATGTDANVDFAIETKGSGTINLNDTTYIGDASLLFPDSDGTNGQVLTTNGAGVLSFTGAGGITATSTGNNQSISFDGSETVLIVAKGSFTGSTDDRVMELSMGGTILDTATIEITGSGENSPFTLTAVRQPSSTSTTLTVGIQSGLSGTLSEVTISTLKF